MWLELNSYFIRYVQVHVQQYSIQRYMYIYETAASNESFMYVQLKLCWFCFFCCIFFGTIPTGHDIILMQIVTIVATFFRRFVLFIYFGEKKKFSVFCEIQATNWYNKTSYFVGVPFNVDKTAPLGHCFISVVFSFHQVLYGQRWKALDTRNIFG